MTESHRNEAVPDPLGSLQDLREALSSPELDATGSRGEVPNQAADAALHVAIALGRCRLLGIDSDEADGTLPPGMAAAAAGRLGVKIEQWTREAADLEKRWEAADDLLESENLCIEPIERRIDAWAAYMAIEEAYFASLEDGDVSVPDFAGVFERLGAVVDQYDDVLQDHIDLLSVAAGTELLNNWRGLLAAPYNELLPWWLDGTLEQAAERIDVEGRATQPSPEAWKRMRRQVYAYSRDQLPKVGWALAAAEGAVVPARSDPSIPLWWCSPSDETVEACLICSAVAADPDEKMTVAFYRNGEPAIDLPSNDQVRLAGVSAKNTSSSQAVFRLGDLLDSDHELILETRGQEGWEPWPRRIQEGE